MATTDILLQEIVVVERLELDKAQSSTWEMYGCSLIYQTTHMSIEAPILGPQDIFRLSMALIGKTTHW